MERASYRWSRKAVRGQASGDTITCPWHHSTFRLADRSVVSVVHGPAHSRLPTYLTRVTEGMVELQGPFD